jgi:hypothetical protein
VLTYEESRLSNDKDASDLGGGIPSERWREGRGARDLADRFRIE